MQLHELQPKKRGRKRKRIGRGGKRGTYSGRGVKGQRSRAGRRLQPSIRGWFKRYPKLRGYKFGRQREKPVVLNLTVLDQKFEPGQEVSPSTLVEKKIIRKRWGKLPFVKILGQGGLKKKLTVRECHLSKRAQEKIKKAGGKIK